MPNKTKPAAGNGRLDVSSPPNHSTANGAGQPPDGMDERDSGNASEQTISLVGELKALAEKNPSDLEIPLLAKELKTKYAEQHLGALKRQLVRARTKHRQQLESENYLSNYAAEAFENKKLTPIPVGYKLQDDGVYRSAIDSDEIRKIAGPAWVKGRFKDSDDENHGLIVDWIDVNGSAHSRLITRNRLHDQGNSLIAELALSGLEILPGRERDLILYLASFQSLTVLNCVTSIGWLPGEKLNFVLPKGTIGDAETILNPEQLSPPLSSNGALGEWQIHVLDKCKPYAYFLFGLCAALAGPLLRFAGMDSMFGFVFHARDGKGKTTLLQTSVTAWGSGADSSEGSSRPYMKRWNMTANAAQQMAVWFNDTVFAMDEVGSFSDKNFGSAIYNLTSGQEKGRLNDRANLRPQKQWRTIFIGSGELPTSQKVEEESSKTRHRGGQGVRLIDVPFFEPSLTASAVDDLKRAAKTYFGVAGPAFVEFLVVTYGTATVLQSRVDTLLEDAKSKLETSGLTSRQARVLKRFALVLVAGKLACEASVLTVEQDAIELAVRKVFQAWLDSDASADDLSKGINALRNFLFANQHARLLPYPLADEMPREKRDVAGYRDQSEQRFYLTESGIREALENYDQYEVFRELLRLNLMLPSDQGKGRYTMRLNGQHGLGDVRLKVYGFPFAILG